MAVIIRGDRLAEKRANSHGTPWRHTSWLGGLFGCPLLLVGRGFGLGLGPIWDDDTGKRPLVLCRRGGKVGVQNGELAQNFFVTLWRVRVHRLTVLSQVVKTRKGLLAVTLERAFSCVFAAVLEGRPADNIPNVTSQVLTACKHHATVTKSRALEHGGASGP